MDDFYSAKVPLSNFKFVPRPQEHRLWQCFREQNSKPRQRGALLSVSKDTPPRHRSSPFFNPQPPLPWQVEIPQDASGPRHRNVIAQEHPASAMLPPSAIHNTRTNHITADPPGTLELLRASTVAEASPAQIYGQRSTQALSFHQIKPMFRDAWAKLDDTLRRNQSMFSEMQRDIKKSTSDIIASKEAVLKEKEELEAITKRDLEVVNIQEENIDDAMRHLETISTDLSVQIAELHHLKEQIEGEQAFLTRMLSDCCKDEQTVESEKFKLDLQNCEVKILLFEKELDSSKVASEKLEQAGLRRIDQLNEVLNEMPQGIVELSVTLDASYNTNSLGKAAQVHSKDTRDGTERYFRHDLNPQLSRQEETLNSETGFSLLESDCRFRPNFDLDRNARFTRALQGDTCIKSESWNTSAYGERLDHKRLSNDACDGTAYPQVSRNSKVARV